MRVLVAGFHAQDRERISAELLGRGHQALCVGAEIAVAMAPGFEPDWVIVPPGDDGIAVREALIEVLDGAIFQIANAADAVEGGPDAHADNQWHGEDATGVQPKQVQEQRASLSNESVPTPSLGRATPVQELEAGAAVLPAGDLSRPTVQERQIGNAPGDAMGIPVGRRDPTLTAPDLAAKLEQVRFGDYHSILEVSRAASPFLVREHFDALSRLYNPTGWPHRLTAAEVHHLAEIGQGLREAISILGHPELRARYETATAGTR